MPSKQQNNILHYAVLKFSIEHATYNLVSFEVAVVIRALQLPKFQSKSKTSYANSEK